MAALGGRTIVVTRPREQAAGLRQAIAAAGGEALVFPLLDIADLPDHPDCRRALAELATAALAVFISPNAVKHGLVRLGVPPLAAAWPSHLRVAAVGQGTARALRAAGFAEVIAPSSGFDSEALLALPELGAPAVAGKTVVIFKGEGGRDLLAGTLGQRGAVVFEAPCYRRLPPSADVSALLSLYRDGRLGAIVLSSSEAARHLGDLVPAGERELLATTPVFCSHQRIAEAAAAIGCRLVALTEPGDAGILAGLTAYNWPSP